MSKKIGFKEVKDRAAGLVADFEATYDGEGDGLAVPLDDSHAGAVVLAAAIIRLGYSAKLGTTGDGKQSILISR